MSEGKMFLKSLMLMVLTTVVLIILVIAVSKIYLILVGLFNG